MKKIILLLAISLTTLASFASDKRVDARVLEIFTVDFSAAKEVSWTIEVNYYKADFTLNEQRVSAYYAADGELIGITRFITSLDLPMHLQTALRKNYDDFWISDLFEVTKPDSAAYYVTLENAETILVMKASTDGSWSEYKKVRKS